MNNETNRKFLKGQAGFTLVELLGVVAIIAVLAAIAITGIRGAFQASYQESVRANARTLIEQATMARSLGYSESWSENQDAMEAIMNASTRLQAGITTPVGLVRWDKGLEDYEVYALAVWISYRGIDGRADELLFETEEPTP